MVTGLDAEQAQPDLESGGTGRERGGVGGTDALGELAFEGIDLRSERRDQLESRASATRSSSSPDWVGGER